MPLIINPVEFIQNNWTLTKKNLKPFWDKLSNNDILSIDNYENLIDKLMSVYDYSHEELNEKLALFVISLKSSSVSEQLIKLKATLRRYTYKDDTEWKNSLKK